jgi:hypothetical protein
MTDRTDVPVIPAFGLLPDPRAAANPKHILREALSNENIFSEVLPYYVNGGVCGHKIADGVEAVNVICKHKVYAERLQVFNMTKMRMVHALNNVLRERYAMDKHWKLQDVSKRVREYQTRQAIAA